MGACCAKKQDREAGIKYQIERTVVEQQKIRQEEEEEEQQIQIQCQSPSSRSKNFDNEIQNHTEIYNLVTQPGGEEIQENAEDKKPEKAKKKKVEHKQEDVNYLRKVEHRLGIKSLVVELAVEGEMKYYKISILIEYKDYKYNLNLNGTLTIQQDFNYFTINPTTYQKASKYSRFSTFFSSDNYFSADKDCVNNFNSFDKLLNVVRNLQEFKSNAKKIQKRHSMIIKETVEEMLLVESKNHEMLEIITIVDIEYQPRFLNLLFHLLIQKYFKQLESSLVFITNTTFLFEKPPQFDQPNVYKLGLFYDKLDYSLKDLQQLLLDKKIELSKYLYQKLVVNLLNIFYNCYSNFLYRINFTLSTVYFVSKYKCFKVQSFNRLKYLLQFGCQQDQEFKNVEEKKYHLFCKAFKKDLFALCDLILYFKDVNNQSFKKLQTKRKRFFSKAKKDNEEEEDDNYLIYAEKMFPSRTEQNILEFFRLVAYSNDIKQIDKTLADCLPIIESLQKSITEYEIKQEQKEMNYHSADHNNQDLNNRVLQDFDLGSNESVEEEKTLTTFQFDFNEENEKLSLNKDKLKENEKLYKELIYQSLFYESSFLETYSHFKQTSNSTQLENAHSDVLHAFYQARQMTEDSWQFKLEMISQLMKKPIEILNQIFSAQLDNFFVTLLFQILTLTKNKPLPLLNELQRSINVQLKEKLRKRKQQKAPSSQQNVIEQKKYIMMQLMFAQAYLSHFNYYQAIHKIQKVIGFQLKNSSVASLFYGYSLLVSGEIQKESLQAVSAMLNLEMGQVIYQSFFPEYIAQEINKDDQDEQQVATTDKNNNNGNGAPTQQFTYKKVQNLATSNKSKLELLLGLSYFEIHDQENSIRCLKTAEQLLLRSFNLFADEVIVVVLKLLEIYVLQDDIGSALKITKNYATKMAQYYREGKIFKRRIVAKLQFVMGSIYEFNGQLISAIRFIERSNKTYANSKCLNFIVQMHFQAKKLILIQKLKDAFLLIKNNQYHQDKSDLSLFKTLNESMNSVFLSQFYRQRFVQKSPLLLDKFGSKLMKVTSFIRAGKRHKALKFVKKCLRILSKNKKDEMYAILTVHQTELMLQDIKNQEQAKLIEDQIEVIERYFIFPKKDFHLINFYILLMIQYSKMNDSKLVSSTYQKTQQAIDDFFEALQWKSISVKQDSQKLYNKFEILMKRGRMSLLYQISAIVELIEYFNSLKKQIFNGIFGGKPMQEESEKIRVKYQEFFTKLNENLLNRKEQCLFGYCQQTRIKKSSEQSKTLPTQLSTQQTEQKSDTNINNLSKLQDSKAETKIVLDVRSLEEIMISNRRRTKIQQVSLMDVPTKNQPTELEKSSSANKRMQNSIHRQKNEYTQSERIIKKPTKMNPFESTLKKSFKK